MGNYSIISTEALLLLLNSANTQLIDARSPDAYNGWTRQGQHRPGHIKGARCLPVKWTAYIDWIEIVRSKGILSENDIVIYAEDENDSIQVADMFSTAGYKKVIIYKDFQDAWVPNDALPMDYLPRFRQLVPPWWVKSIIDRQNTEFDQKRVVLVHAHYRNPEAYSSGHIPGAISMDTLAIESPETWNLRTPGELEAALLGHGITSDTVVILYGKYMFPDNNDPFPGSAAGDIGAIRCAFAMMYAGVKDVRVINGGYQSWIDAGYDTETTIQPIQPQTSFGSVIPAMPSIVVDINEAKMLLDDPHGELVCIRSWPEYIGEVSGYNYIEKKGRIPGAVFGNCGSDAYHMENYRNVDNTMREYTEIQAFWNAAGITPDKRLAFYCGTGWRGSEAFFNAWLMGYPDVAVFDGGWYEWSNDPENPYETGIPENMPLTELNPIFKT
ncbi:MAG: rhodanese-like domain-containing protein [Lentimicrobiaceae bacterium]|nr:rhodanese-like domain-containing protein [Lentimicrobiaceae bacterium]